MNNKSFQEELDRYFQTLHSGQVLERVVFNGSLSKAHAKLKYQAFVEVNDHLARSFYELFNPETWFGYNLLTIDGTTLRVPAISEVDKHFGAWKPNKGEKPCPKARASQMFDVLKKISVDAIISLKSEGERELAAFHFLKLCPPGSSASGPRISGPLTF